MSNDKFGPVPADALYKDPSQPIEARVEDLLSRMTLEEKVAQLCGNLPGSVFHGGEVDYSVLNEQFKDGHGRFTQYSMLGLADPETIANVSNKLQDFFVNQTRLGIPVALQTENLCGYPAAGGTLFPAQINVGSTWEPELAEKMSKIIGQESRAVGISSAMSPVVDVSRDPRWGRVYETYGEDHYLNSQMGIHYVRGMQGEGVSCIGKHFLGYAETQAGLNTATTRLSDRELYEVFATPFEAAMKEADLDAVMANYAEIDGLPIVDNPHIAKDLLRDQMGFKGVLTSDGAAIMRTFGTYKIANSYEEAGLIAKKAGTDTEIPVGGSFKQLPKYVRSGELDEACIDESVRRVLRVKFKCGLFENPYCDVEKVKDVLRNEEKEALSRKMAADSLILLKNDGTLPLKKGTKLAVIGPHADSLRYPVSGYTYPAYIEMIDASRKQQGTTFAGIADEQAKNKDKKKDASGGFSMMFAFMTDKEMNKLGNMNSVLRELKAESLKEVLSQRFDVTYAQGCDIIGPSTDGFAEAVEAAKEADVVVMALGGNCGWINVTGGEGKDRSSLDLPGVQEQLLETVAAVGKPVVVVLYGPGLFSVNWANEHVSSILQAWMPGPFAGQAVSDALDGTINPGGKLTVTVPKSAGQIPIFYNHKFGSGYNSWDTTGVAVFSGGYTNENGHPLYHFGYGLSYTSFKVDELKVAETKVPTDGEITVSCRVTNTGDREGSEVVQLYTTFHGAHVVRPNRQLCGFKRVELAKGESKKVTFHLSTRQLGYYNENMVFGVEKGTLDVCVGTSSANIEKAGEVKLVGESVELLGRRVFTCPVEVE